jgi:hypothetical protein
MANVDTFRDSRTRVICVPKTLSVAVNQLIVTAITGSVIRVLGFVAQSNNAAIGNLRFLSASGGTEIFSALSVPLGATAGQAFILPLDFNGYFETTVSQGLYADCAVDTIKLNLFYIPYVP